MSVSMQLDHTLIGDPAFAKLVDLKHAESCNEPHCRESDWVWWDPQGTFHHSNGYCQKACHFPNCIQTRFLIKHCTNCAKPSCKYLDCGLARLLLAHDRKEHDNSSWCPLCRKETIIRRALPGKGARDGEEEENGDKKEVVAENEQIIHRPHIPYSASRMPRSQKHRMVQHLHSIKSNNAVSDSRKRKLVVDAGHAKQSKLEQDKAEILDQSEDVEFAVERARMTQIKHSRSCPWDYCCKKCYWTKQLLAHLKTCADYECMRPGCTPSKTLLMHVNNCRPVDRQCKQCTKMPEAGNQLLYRGRDYFADLAGDVLRKICGYLDNDSLNALQYVNHRVLRFFQFPREIRGLYQKKTFAKLCISQLKDGSVLLLFREVAGQNFAHICKRSGEEERFFYSAVNLTTAHAHIESTYELIHNRKHPKMRLLPTCYRALALLLEKFSFTRLLLGWIHVDEELKSFFTSRDSGIDFSRASKNVKRENSSIISDYL